MGEAISAPIPAESTSQHQRRNALVLLPSAKGHVVTNAMVAEALDDECGPAP